VLVDWHIIRKIKLKRGHSGSMAGGEGGPSFESTPSWIVGVAVLIIVSISLVVEKLLHHLGQASHCIHCFCFTFLHC